MPGMSAARPDQAVAWPTAARRVVAIFLPDLVCELARCEGDAPKLPLAALMTDDANQVEHADQADAAARSQNVRVEPATQPALAKADVLAAVNEPARRLGIRSGQTVAEARALAAHLVIRRVSTQKLRNALGRIAEVVLAFGTTASIEAGDGHASLDTVWIDLTGTAHLHHGEEQAMIEIAARIAELGHRLRIAAAEGPRLARAAAVFADQGETIVPTGGGREMMARLPFDALPLSRDHIVWLNRLGLWTVGDIAALPPEAVGSRLGQRWREALDLALGRDDTPLLPYQAPRVPSESAEWDEGVSAIEPLLFTLRGLTSRLSARLQGRGEAAQALELWAPFDRSIAELRGVRGNDQRSSAVDTVAHARGREGACPGLRFRIDLPSPLARKEDIFRVFKSKLEHTRLAAPARSLTITAHTLTEASAVQLALGGDSTCNGDPKSLAILLAELSAEIGASSVGVLAIAEVHRPEARTLLEPIRNLSAPAPLLRAATLGDRDEGEASDSAFPTRMLKVPLPLSSLPRPGMTLSIDHHLFTVARVKHALRIDQVEWWKPDPVCRDYLRVWLRSGRKNVEALVYSDRLSGRAFLHGYFD